MIRSLARFALFPVLLALVPMAGPVPLAAQALTPSGSAGWDTLVVSWEDTPAGSEEERDALAAMREFLTERLGESSLEAYLRWWSSPNPDDAQVDRDEAMAGAENAGLRWGRAEEMLETFAEYRQLTANPADLEQIQADAAQSPPDPALITERLAGVELALNPPEAVSSRDPVAFSGVVRNLTDEYIYLGTGDLVVEVPARLLGMRGAPQFIEARFPPTLRKVLDEEGNVWTAIEPQRETRVSWYHETGSRGFLEGATSWLNQKPGDYSVRVYLEGWPDSPPRAGSGRRAIRQESDDYTVHVRASLTHLLPLAWIGGLLVLLLQGVMRTGANGVMPESGYRGFVKGVVASLILVTVIIIMNEFTQGTSLLPTLDMTTFGAAVAAGMLIQWLGYRFYAPLISGITGTPDPNQPAPTPAPGDGGAGDDGG